MSRKRQRNQKTVKIRKDRGFIGGGVECEVYAMTPDTVVKCYESAAERNFAFSMQRKAYRIGCAPPALEKVKVKGLEYRSWGYISAKADTTRFDEGEIEATRIRKGLEKKLKALEIANDLHSGNMGFYKGWLVCIDFGPCSKEPGRYS